MVTSQALSIEQILHVEEKNDHLIREEKKV
jgi:hypothetical protein